MIRRVLISAVGLLCASAVSAETLLATRTIRAQAIIGPDDVAIVDTSIPGAITNPSDVVGMEARVVLYAGRPIRPGDFGPPAIVERNAVVSLVFRKGGLVIVTEGRALGRGGVGDTLRVMNLSSRSTVSGVVADDGSILVASPHS